MAALAWRRRGRSCLVPPGTLRPKVAHVHGSNVAAAVANGAPTSCARGHLASGRNRAVPGGRSRPIADRSDVKLPEAVFARRADGWASRKCLLRKEEPMRTAL